jgi:hypothetical protein
MDVAIKYLRAEHVNDSSNVEFLQEIMILMYSFFFHP